MRSRSKPGHSCRASGVLVLSVVAGLAGCTTSARLTQLAGSSTEQAVDDLAAQPGAFARLTTSAPPLQPIASATGPYSIVGHEAGWLTLSDQVTTVRVPLAHVQSVSTYHHTQGAADGALAAGAVGFILGFAAAFFLPTSCPADGPCNPSPKVVVGFEVGAIVGLVTAALGAAVGGVVGHETRYAIGGP